MSHARSWTRVVGVMVMEQLAMVSNWMPDNHTFGWDGLKNLILDHENWLEVEAEVRDFWMMSDWTICNLQIENQVFLRKCNIL